MEAANQSATTWPTFSVEDLIGSAGDLGALWFYANDKPLYGDPVIYVIEFSGGLLKVGQTTDYDSRIKSHRYTARDLGETWQRVWWQRSSALLEDEHVLKTIAIGAGGKPVARRREWFLGADFDTVVASAKASTEAAPRKIPDYVKAYEQKVQAAA